MNRTITALALAGSLAVGMTACDSGSKGSDPTSGTSAAAPEKPDTVYVKKPAKGGTVEGSVMADGITKALTDAESYEQVSGNPSEPGKQHTTQVVNKGPKKADTKTREGDRESMLQVDGVTYMNVTSRSSHTANGTTSSTSSTSWMKVDPDKPGMATAAVALMGSTDGGPPGFTVTILKTLEGSKVTFAGDDDKGARYTAKVPAETFVENFLKSAKMPASQIASEKAKVKGKKLDYTIWLDDHGRPVQIDVDGSAIDDNAGGASKEGSIERFSYGKWGEKFEIKAPPASQVTTPPGMFPDTGSSPSS